MTDKKEKPKECHACEVRPISGTGILCTVCRARAHFNINVRDFT